jgi:U3 small nucleolar ribonucleoprotein protein LCP5
MSNGISLLSVRLHSLLSYLINVSFLILLKASGKSINGHPVVKRLIELRAVLEKTKPLELKLNYQISKLVQMAAMDISAPSAPVEEEEQALMFKPNLDNFAVEDEEEAEDEKKDVYKPPRLVSVPYNERRITQNIKETASQSRLLRDITAEFSTAPEVINANESFDTKDDREWNDRVAFEEENFIRMNVTRKDKALLKRMEKTRLTNDLNDLREDFKDIEGLHSLVDSEPQARVGDKRPREDVEGVIAKASRGRRSEGKDAFAKDKSKLKFKKKMRKA